MAKLTDNDTIDIGITIPLKKLLRTRLLVQASSGGGKSWLLRRLAEQIMKKKIQVILIDPEDEFFTLREKYPFALISKEGGDIPLNIRYAEALAHKLLETNLSAILALYELDLADRQLFVNKFLTALVNSPRKLWHDVVIIIDEADEYAPEGKENQSTKAMVRLASRGRKRGFSVFMATQRIAKLSKGASADLINKLVGLTGQDTDRRRAADELGLATKEDRNSLLKLQPGNFYACGPALGYEITSFKVSKTETRHVDPDDHKNLSIPTPKAIMKILSHLSNIPEEAEKDLVTKKQYEAEIERLKKELKTEKGVKQMYKTDPNHLSVALDKQKKSLETEFQRKYKALTVECQKLIDAAGKTDIQSTGKWKKFVQDLSKKYSAIISTYNKKIIAISTILKELSTTNDSLDDLKPPGDMVLPKLDFASLPEYKVNLPITFTHDKGSASKGTAQKPNKPASNGNTVDLPPGEAAILIALAQFGHTLDRNQLTVLTGYKKSTRDAYILRLKDKGYVYQDGIKVGATDEGIAFLGDDYQPLPTGDELRQHWFDNLPEGESKILQVLIGIYPEAISRDEISEQTGYKKSTRDAYLLRMTSKEILEFPAKGMVKASDNLFD